MASLAEEKRRQKGYLEALEEEQRKLLVFSRELPLSLELITQAIDNFRREMGGENDSGDGPVPEEFIPLRSGTSSSGIKESIRGNWRASDTKTYRLASVHLRASAAAEAFHASNLGELKQTTTASNLVGMDAKRVRGAFQPFQREVPKPTAPGLSMKVVASSSTTTENIAAPTKAGRGNAEDDNDKQPQGFPQPHRRQRRCWSAYLHRRFLCVLEELGGSKRATPKQIRELMKVDGLTNDEIKSHLQKFRLHTRRPVTTVHSSSTSGDGPAQTPPHQFVVVGGIWVPPTEYAAAEGCSAASMGSCSPITWLPLELGLLEEQHDKKQRIVKSPSRPLGFHEGCTHDDDCPVNEAAEKSKSSTTSSSSLATAISEG